jgi:hypothetical protein
VIARHDTHTDKPSIWSRLAEPIPQPLIDWRQDGKVIISADGKFFARFVPYINANTARTRLDSVVPGEWDLTLEVLPPRPDANGEDVVSFKARLQILGVIREDVGQGSDYKAASSDAFKRVAVRFGIANELYDMGQNWVQVDGDGKFAKPLEDPGLVYARRSGSGSASANGSSAAAPVARETKPAPRQETSVADRQPAGEDLAPPATNDTVACPKCGGRMFDNRLSKRNPKAPDFKCRDRSCDGVIWPPRPSNGAQRSRATENDGPAFPGDPGPSRIPGYDTSPLGSDEVPF